MLVPNNLSGTGTGGDSELVRVIFVAAAGADALLLEDGFYLLLEDGGKLLLE